MIRRRERDFRNSTRISARKPETRRVQARRLHVRPIHVRLIARAHRRERHDYALPADPRRSKIGAEHGERPFIIVTVRCVGRNIEIETVRGVAALILR